MPARKKRSKFTERRRRPRNSLFHRLPEESGNPDWFTVEPPSNQLESKPCTFFASCVSVWTKLRREASSSTIEILHRDPWNRTTVIVYLLSLRHALSRSSRRIFQVRSVRSIHRDYSCRVCLLDERGQIRVARVISKQRLGSHLSVSFRFVSINLNSLVLIESTPSRIEKDLVDHQFYSSARDSLGSWNQICLGYR